MHMRTWNPLKITGGVAVAALLVAAQAQADIAYNGTVAYDNPAIVGNRAVANITIGMGFTANSPIMITAIGAFDSGQNGFGGPVQVAIYDATTQLQVPGTLTSFSGTAQTIVGGSRFSDIADVALAAGSYMIVAHYTSADVVGSTAFNPYKTTYPWSFDGAGLLTANTSFYKGTTLMLYPTTPHPGIEVGYAAGTFSFAPVPEVGQFAMAAVGLLGSVYIGRNVLLGRKMKLA